MKKIIFMTLFLSFSICYAKGSQDLPKQISSNERNDNNFGVFRIYDINGTIGTSFYCKFQDKNILLTAAHNIMGLKPNKFFIDINGEKVTVKNFLQPDITLDLALLEIEDFTILGEFTPLLLENENILEYSDLICFHFSVFDGFLKEQKILSTGNFIGKQEGRFYATLNVVEKGASGAPVIAENNGTFVGMITNRINNDQYGYTGIIYGISSETIYKTIYSIFSISNSN